MLAFLAVAVALQSPINVLSDAETSAGWKLLFDGKSTAGWHNFQAKEVAAGWQVKDGALTVVDPEHAGDLATDEKFTWFDLSVEFNFEKGQNSGVMFRVTEEGKAIWHSGPEIQIYDHKREPGVEATGSLYQLYEPTGTDDPVKPAGEWNRFDIHIAPDKCWTDLNGVRLYEFVIDSEDFMARVAKSKFSEFPFFAKSKTGSIGIQGDHGHVAFRNVKIRPLNTN